MTDAGAQGRGRHRIYLGYAAGVGKTYQMLDDGRQTLSQGADVVIGYLETHGRRDTIAKAEGMEVVPRRSIVYRGTTFQEMDTEAVLRRRPQICLIDELAHTNVPGAERAKRWEDVRVILAAGIDVHSTLNVQHLESLNDQVWQLTGVRVRETVPDWVVNEASEIVLVDVTPRALRNRLERGVVYSPEKAVKALEHFFAEQNLNALRELAMRQTAHEIEEHLSTRESSAPAQSLQPPLEAEQRHRILVCLDERPSTAMLIRRGKRSADYLRADCLAVYVKAGDAWSRLSPAGREAVEKHLDFARNLRIETHVVEGSDFAQALVDFARSHQVTRLVMGRSGRTSWAPSVRGSRMEQVVRLARDMEVTIVADRCR